MATTEHAEGQQHPITLYLVVWGWLFVLSTGSYLVDFFGLEGYLRWSLILAFMILKAGLIVAVFMHMAWERLALVYAILAPPLFVLVFVGMMASESTYTYASRTSFFGDGRDVTVAPIHRTLPAPRESSAPDANIPGVGEPSRSR